MFVNVDWFFFSHRQPIARAAKKNNVDMVVYTDITNTQEKINEYEYTLCQSPIHRTSKSIFHVIFEFSRAYFLVKNNKPDLIHAVTIKPILILGLIARFQSIPIVAAISGLGPAFQPNSLISNLRLIIIIVLLRFIFKNKKARIICQSKDDCDVLINKFIALSENISLFPGSGVDVEAYSPQKKKVNGDKYILMSSRILIDKGIKEYCLAANMVRERFGNEYKFLLSGPIDRNSPTYFSKSDLKKLTDSCGVEYIGNRKDMPELLASAIMFVLPSYYAEGMPKVLLEASSCGIPIITTDHPGCRDSIIEGKTGLLVPIKNSDALASAIIKLIENKSLCIEMGNKGRILAMSSYRDSKVVSNHYSLYRDLVL